MIRRSIARSYAKALFGAGERDGKYRAYLEQLKEILQTLNDAPKIGSALMLPLLEIDRRKEILSDLVAAFGTEAPVAAVLDLLLERNRMNYLSLICDVYQEMVDEKEGRVKGIGYSAYPISDAARARIEEALGERLKKRVELHMLEDKDLIGGIKVIVGGMRIDGSVKRQLELLNESMTKE